MCELKIRDSLESTAALSELYAGEIKLVSLEMQEGTITGSSCRASSAAAAAACAKE